MLTSNTQHEYIQEIKVSLGALETYIAKHLPYQDIYTSTFWCSVEPHKIDVNVDGIALHRSSMCQNLFNRSLPKYLWLASYCMKYINDFLVLLGKWDSFGKLFPSSTVSNSQPPTQLEFWGRCLASNLLTRATFFSIIILCITNIDHGWCGPLTWRVVTQYSRPMAQSKAHPYVDGCRSCYKEQMSRPSK